MRRTAAVAAFAIGAQAWDASCLSACKPTNSDPYPVGPSVGTRYVCPMASRAVGPSGTKAYVVSMNGNTCPGQCSPIMEKGECENAATWLRLGMDGTAGPCPTNAELVGPSGMWTAEEVSFLNAPTHHQRLGGCSWRPMDSQKLWYNRGDFHLPGNPYAAITLQATPINDWLLCACKDLNDLPKYTPVMAGSECPNVEREMAQGAKPTCGILTTEKNCEEAATTIGAPDTDLQMCVGSCQDANPANHVMQTALNTPEVGPHRPAGCHYRYHPTIADDHLWFNPHYSMDHSYAMPPGTGGAPDYLICGCGDVAKYATYSKPHDSCEAVNDKGTSKACGVGQTCSPEGISDFRCTCLYSKDELGQPHSALNMPAQCEETVPIKYISWVDGPECPWDEHTQCLSPPTKERCEKAAVELGLADVDTKASLPHSLTERDLVPRGCLYNTLASPSHLYWNPQGPAQLVGASPATSLICECVRFPMFVPKLAGGTCSSGNMPCRNVRSGFECGLAADATGIPAPVGAVMDKWNNTLCAVDPEAGPGSPYKSCAELNCSDPAVAPVRVCKWVDNMYEMVAPGSGQGSLDGCYYHAHGAYSGSRLWFSNASEGNAAGTNSPADFRLCDCADEGDHSTIARRLGFHSAGVGDCSKGQMICQANDPDCANGMARTERYNCVGLPKVACHADSRVCTWIEAESRCDWANSSFAAHAEVPAYFSDCLEHCLLLCNCTGVSFFTAAGASPSDLGGCDFFRGSIVGATGETIREGKGAGDWHCWSNTPENPVLTPAPSFRCPKCEMIPGQFECRNTHGCAWSAAQSCCCDPFISACSNSWHTQTATKEQCEATDDNGRQCKWLLHNDSGMAVCELPLAQCVDEYMTFTLGGAIPATAQEENDLCVAIMHTLINLVQLPHVQQGCGSCNVSEAAGGGVRVDLAVDLGGDKTCGQASRIAARHQTDLSALTALTFAGRAIGVIDIRSKCWEDCALDPKCPKGPTAAPTPISQWTRPPRPDVQQGFPSSSPTKSPGGGCPVGFEVKSGTPTECICEIFDNETKPYNDRDHTYCRHIPQYWYGAYHFACPHCLQTESEVQITCPNNWETCELFLVLYNCPGCSANATHSVNGMWPASMPADGWTPGSCAPGFCEANRTHNLIAWHKQILGGQNETLPETATDPTMYASFLVKEGKICSSVTDPADCDGVCQWNSTHCITNFCPKREKVNTPGSPVGTGGNPGPEPTPCECAPGAPEGDCSA